MYPQEQLLALGRGRSVKTPTLGLPGYNPWSWLGVTQSRFVEIPFANQNVSSHHLSAVHQLELRRGMFGRRRLYVNIVGAPDEFGLDILEVSKQFAASIEALLAGRHQAPPLPAETTTYERVAVPVSDPGLAAMVGPESIGFRCSRCGGSCGVDTSSSVFGNGGPAVYEHCSGCLRTVAGPAQETAR